MELQQVLAEIVEVLLREYDPEQVILFGSHARGDAAAHSDVDILIVKDTEETPVGRIVEVSRLLRRFRRLPYRVALDILVRTPDEMRRRLSMGDDFLSDVTAEGRVLYDRRAA